jgi:inner membrane transporter RhtA
LSDTKFMFLPYLLLLLAMISIQFGASFAKGLFPLTGAAGMALVRLGFASLILWFLIRPWRYQIKKEHFKSLLFYGLSLGAMNLSFYLALNRIPLGIAVALEFVGPLAVAVFSSRSRMDFVWVILAAIGIYLILPQSDYQTSIDYLGVFFALLAGLFWGLYIIFGKKAGEHVPAQFAAAWGMLFAFVMVVPFGVLIDGVNLLRTDIILPGLGVALFSSALPYSLEMYSLKKIPEKTFGILMSIEPALASLAGLLVLNETLTLIQWLAIACIMLASFGTALTHSK